MFGDSNMFAMISKITKQKTLVFSRRFSGEGQMKGKDKEEKVCLLVEDGSSQARIILSLTTRWGWMLRVCISSAFAFTTTVILLFGQQNNAVCWPVFISSNDLNESSNSAVLLQSGN